SGEKAKRMDSCPSACSASQTASAVASVSCSSGGASGATSECRTRTRMLQLYGSRRGVTAEKGIDDAADQIAIRHSFEPGDETQIGAVGVQSGERIDFDEMRLREIVAADVDPPAVAASQCP